MNIAGIENCVSVEKVWKKEIKMREPGYLRRQQDTSSNNFMILSTRPRCNNKITIMSQESRQLVKMCV